jgi:hypothetical protein
VKKRISAEEKRILLKAAGWRREDRKNQELWVRPWNGIGWQPIGITLQSAFKRLQKE